MINIEERLNRIGQLIYGSESPPDVWAILCKGILREELKDIYENGFKEGQHFVYRELKLPHREES